MIYHIEKWKSNNKNEIHYFKRDKVETYIFGYNPKFISKDKMKQILKIINLKNI